MIAALLPGAMDAPAVSQSVVAGDPAGNEARTAYDILDRRCFSCHGANGVAMKDVFVLNRDRLLAARTVVPGDANSLLLKMVDSGAMPMGGPELTAAEKATLRQWVLSGAPDWGDSQNHARPRERLSESAILAAIRDDLLKSSERTRPFLRYFSIAQLYNAGIPHTQLAIYREALSKLVNSLSWRREIAAPIPIDPSKTVYRIDLRDYGWTAPTWAQILSVYPYGVRTVESRLINQLSGSPVPYIRADWFAANASVAPLYTGILGLPNSVQELERLLAVDVRKEIDEEKNVARAGLRSSGVSQNNRVLERHGTASGAYWKSFDFKSSVDSQNIFKDPIRFSPSGGEMIFNLPNGMQAYFLADALGRRLDQAPVAIVSDRYNPDDPVIYNGRSCMGCHYAGIKDFRDDIRPIIIRTTIGGFDRDKALSLYRPQQALDRIVEVDSKRFQEAVEQAEVRPSASALTEPVTALSRRFLADITEAQAAAEAGLEETDFRTRVRGSARLISLGYGQLLVPNGAMRRDAWEQNFGTIVMELQAGEYAQPKATLSDRGTGVVAPAFVNPTRTGVARTTGIISADPNDILRSARSIFVMSNTVYLKPDQLENDLSKLPGFKEAGLVFVRDVRAADLKIELDRPVFTYTFTFVVTSMETSVLVMSGKVTAFDGNYAAPKIAKEILRRIQAAHTG
jgi:hypothetical protein